MKDYDNSKFYKSSRWKKISQAYMTSKAFICERCGRPATICHHKQYLDGENVNNPAISLNFSNLEALCHDCHNKEHYQRHSRLMFSDSGDVVGVRKGSIEKQFEKEQEKIDNLLCSLGRGV